MAAKDLGTKFTCFKCGTKFYDLRKPVPVCPKCGANQTEAPSKAPPPPERRVRAAKPAVVEPEEAEIETVEDDEADADDDAEDAAEDDEP